MAIRLVSMVSGRYLFVGRCGKAWLEDAHPAALPPTRQALEVDDPH